ncbi:oxysterol-binding protein-related protein 5 [Pteropus medius]|uniref:oxysterol-binding protein-related protein 5 n=1 Tax=Pteropus vampyrus TaxID=132908 RepID=UPI00196B0EE3|nr:oxysterol-binding protein-related protein 5 [Pteropus giganteus]
MNECVSERCGNFRGVRGPSRARPQCPPRTGTLRTRPLWACLLPSVIEQTGKPRPSEEGFVEVTWWRGCRTPGERTQPSFSVAGEEAQVPGKDMESNGPSLPRDEGPPTPGSATKVSPVDYRLCNGSDKECVSPTAKVTKKETLKAQKESYRQEKKRASKQLFSALTDPSAVIMADSLKIRGTLKSWTKLWCVLKPGVLLIYKTPKVGQWVGTVLLHCCELLERPSKKDGFCFKLFHPLDQSVWAIQGPKGESVGSITQPLPSSYLIFRAASELDGRCWLDALELALRCSSLLRLSTCKQGSDREPGSSPDASPSSLCGLPPSATSHDQDLFPLNGSSLENDAFSDKSERELAQESDDEAQDHSRKTNESGSDRSEAPGGPTPRGTTYVEQVHEELGELGEASQVETVSEENRSLMWLLLKQLRPGMDLSRVALPTFVLEPRSFLSKLSDYYCHADLLSRATLEEDAYTRIKLVLQWYLSGFYKKPKGIKKPYNPILGETFRCRWYHPQTDSHTFYIAEQVSHHPPVSAFHVSNRKDGFCISGSITAKSRFYGNSLSALLDGKATLTFLSRGEEYTLTMPYAHCKGEARQPSPLGRAQAGSAGRASGPDTQFPVSPSVQGTVPVNWPRPAASRAATVVVLHMSPLHRCPRCGKEARRLRALHEAILSIREAQQELHRHLSAMLSSTARARQAPATGLLQRPRSWFLLCVFLACQLLINYILT